MFIVCYAEMATHDPKKNQGIHVLNRGWYDMGSTLKKF